VFILTGAGVSAESGLGTFRDKGGIWSQFDLKEVSTPKGFRRDPQKVLDFYNLRRENLRGAQPNAAHVALARLEAGLEARGGGVFICTQNVDELHEAAGSRNVHAMHGRLNHTLCNACQHRFPDGGAISVEQACPACGVQGQLRPDVVWFGEDPYGMEEILDQLRASDLFVSIGTSGSVYPAAAFVRKANNRRIKTCEINLEPSENARRFRQTIYGTASEVVPAWVDQLLA